MTHKLKTGTAKQKADKTHKRIFIDIETDSFIDLKISGTYNYCSSDKTRTLIVRYCFDDEKKVFEYLPQSQPIPDNLRNFTGKIIAHNFWFELYNFVRMYQLGQMPIHFLDIARYECTMSMAYAAGLPGALADLSSVLNLKHGKQTDSGSKLIQKYSCRYKKHAKDITQPEFKEDFKLFSEYCAYDVLATRELYNILPKLSAFESQTFELDKVKNVTGLQLDIKRVNLLITTFERTEKKLKAMAKKKYGVNKHGTLRIKSNSDIKDLIHEVSGGTVPTARKEILLQLYNQTKNNKLKELIGLRRALSTANLKKLYQMQNLSDSEGVVRNSMQWHYDITGRDAGRGIQPHNFERVALKTDIKTHIAETFKLANSDKLSDLIRVPGLLNTAQRSCIVARKKKVFFIADFSTIEPRVLFWFAGAQRGIEAFNNDLDIYSYFMAFKLSKNIKEVTKEERQQGKLAVLSFGYGQSEDAAAAINNISVEFASELRNFYLRFVPEVKKFWFKVHADAIKSVRYGVKIETEKYSIEANKTRLKINLPSGRPIMLFRPFFSGDQLKFHDKKGVQTLWYGRLINYMVQGLSGDIMKHAELECMKQNLGTVLLDVHDEIVLEADDLGATQNRVNFKKFIGILETSPPWFNMRLQAKGEISKYYKKI